MTTTVELMSNKWTEFYLHSMTDSSRINPGKACMYIQDAANVVYSELPLLRISEEIEPVPIEGKEEESLLVFPAFTFVKLLQIRDGQNNRVPINLMNKELINAIRPISFCTYKVPEEYSYIDVFKVEYQAKPDWSEDFKEDILEIPQGIMDLIFYQASYFYYSRYPTNSTYYRKSGDFLQKYMVLLNSVKRSNMLGTNRTYKAITARSLGLP